MEVYITHAKRTAIGNFMGGFRDVPAVKLGECVIRELLKVSEIDPSEISEVIMGNVLTGGLGQNPARQSAINAGLPNAIPAFTIGKVCGSGLKAVVLGAQAILTGASDIIIAGGQENMSLSMHGLYLRTGKRMGPATMVDQMMYDGLTCVFSDSAMGITAENIAKKFNISRTMQDALAFQSQMKAAAAQEAGKFEKEIVKVEVKTKKEVLTIELDEFIKPNTTIETLQSLKPAFDKDSGSVTAGNASGINDGAAAVIIASKSAIERYNLTPIARIASFASAGVEPDFMGTGPVPASQKALTIASWGIKDLDLIEVNEAFAAQAAYVYQALNLDTDKVNVNGGAIALGHPIGASGARVLVTLLHEMQRRKSKKALATLCIGGGMGISMCLEGL
jgi:acetyl-CoA C-acetyltransferase